MLIEVEKVISEIGGDLTLQLYMALQMKSGAECIFIHSPAMEVAYGIWYIQAKPCSYSSLQIFVDNEVACWKWDSQIIENLGN